MWTLRQFVLVRFVPLGGGRTDKVPLSPTTGAPSDSGDPSNWLDYSTARSLAEMMGPGYGVGFRFTESDTYAFIDVDHCIDEDGVISETAAGVLARFPGAFVETSHSGTGFHIFCRYSRIDPHKCKRTDLGLELYHTARFVALGHTEAGTGSADVDHTEALAAFIQDLLPPKVGEAASEWTTEPPLDYGGPIDDADLVARMKVARPSAGALFGGRVSPKALLECDEDALARAFPPQNPADPFDRSSADAALFAHLAWWTGKDCARMERIARGTPLVRGKWDRRDYIEGTILAACKHTAGYWTRREAPLTVPPLPAPRPPAEGEEPPGIIERAESLPYIVPMASLPGIFDGMVYVESLGAVYIPGRGLMKKDPFRVVFGGHRWEINQESKTIDDAWDVLTRAETWRVPCVEGTCFRPTRPPGEVIRSEGQAWVNVWEPPQVTRRQGDPGRFLELLAKLLPDDRDRGILLAYAAACVQYPGAKFQWWPVVQGMEGNGKTAIARCVAYAVGMRYTHFPNVAEISRSGIKFNSWVYGKLFLILEEVYVPNRREFLEEFKPIVTNSRIQVERKGVDADTRENVANGMMFTNHLDGVPITRDGRRYAPFYTAQQAGGDLERYGMDGDYFPDLYAWLRGEGKYAELGEDYGHSVVAEYLATYPIPAEWNPATNCTRAPETSSTSRAVEESVGPIEQEVREYIARGEPGFCAPWISSLALGRLLKDVGARVSINRRTALLETLGYIPHPALAGGRAPVIVAPDAGKPVLYVKRGSPAESLADPVSIARAYQKAQGVIVDNISDGSIVEVRAVAKG